jgi:hypothetical protein
MRSGRLIARFFSCVSTTPNILPDLFSIQRKTEFSNIKGKNLTFNLTLGPAVLPPLHCGNLNLSPGA